MELNAMVKALFLGRHSKNCFHRCIFFRLCIAVGESERTN